MRIAYWIMAVDPSAACGRHILIVEDDEDLSRSYRELLEQNQYTVSTVSNGIVALKCVLNHPIDAVICDMKMPLVDGDVFFDAVRTAKPELCRRFLFLTGYADSERYGPFLSRERVQVLRKPAAAAQILDALAGLLLPAPDGTAPK